MDKVKKVPALRFPVFSGEWEINRINDLVNKKIIDKPLDGNHGNIHPKSSDFVLEGIPFIMSNNIKNGVLDIKGSYKIKKQQADKLQKGFSIEGDVLLTHKGSVGLTTIVPNLETDYIMLTPQVTYYRVKNYEKLYNLFLRYFFESEIFQKEISIFSDSGTRPYIGITEQRSLFIKYPLISEQQKIADFLTQVDKKIKQLTKKEQLLESYKKGAMQKIFSQELRFKDDNGEDYSDWEDIELDHVASFHRGADLSKSDIITNGKNKCIHYGELFTLYSEFIKTVFSYTNKDNGVKSKAGDILMPSSDVTPQGLAKASVIMEDGVFLGGDINIIRPNNLIDSIFLSYQLNFFKYEIIKLVTGTTVKHIYIKDIKKLLIKIPKSKSEQTKIADFLIEIDNKINKVSKQLEGTKQFKKGLLQKMFV